MQMKSILCALILGTAGTLALGLNAWALPDNIPGKGAAQNFYEEFDETDIDNPCNGYEVVYDGAFMGLLHMFERPNSVTMLGGVVTVVGSGDDGHGNDYTVSGRGTATEMVEVPSGDYILSRGAVGYRFSSETGPDFVCYALFVELSQSDDAQTPDFEDCVCIE